MRKFTMFISAVCILFDVTCCVVAPNITPKNFKRQKLSGLQREPVEAPKNFFRDASQLLKLRFNCDGHIFISFTFFVVVKTTSTLLIQSFYNHFTLFSFFFILFYSLHFFIHYRLQSGSTFPEVIHFVLVSLLCLP